MTARTVGFAWHVHHNILVEWCYGYEKRLAAIAQKPAHEIPLRKRLFQMVKGELPSALDQARVALDQARVALDQAEDALGMKPYASSASSQVRDAYYQAKDAHRQAKNAYAQVLSDNALALAALHATECVDCTWNGWTIFNDS